MKTIYLSLGSNVGNTRANLEEAIERLKEKVSIIKISSFYETEPVGYTQQDWFLNIVIKGKTSCSPYELLDFCQSIEKEMKREKLIRFGPRNIDVDILLYEGFTADEEKLTVPHIRMKERAFVMVPLYEIEPDLIIEERPIKSIIEQLKGEQIRKLEE